MAKFLVTSGSHFEPFTYDELAKPIMQAVEAHNAAQEQYDTIADQAELLRRYVEQEPDNALVRQRYNDYMQKLESLQNNLWRSGFNASTKRDAEHRSRTRATDRGLWMRITTFAFSISP